MRFFGVGSAADRCGLSPEMRGMRTPDHDSTGEGGEERAGCEAAGCAIEFIKYLLGGTFHHPMEYD